MAEFYPEKVRLNASDKLAIRGLFQKTDLSVKSGEEEVYEYFKTQPDLNKAGMGNEMAVRAIGSLKSTRLNSELTKALDSQSPYIQLLAARSVLIQLK